MSDRTPTITPGRANGSPVGVSAGQRAHRRSRTESTPHRAAQLVAPARRFRLPELVGGIFIVAGSVLGILVWSRSTSATTPVLVLARDVQRGQLLTEADFAAAEVRSTGVRLLSFDQRATMLGRVAAVDLPAQTPVTKAIAVEVLAVGTGEALVGRRLKLGEFPGGLTAGAKVRIVLINEQVIADPTAVDAAAVPAAAASAPGILATVEDIAVGEGSADNAEITLRLADSAADAVAAADGVRLIQVEG